MPIPLTVLLHYEFVANIHLLHTIAPGALPGGLATAPRAGPRAGPRAASSASGSSSGAPPAEAPRLDYALPADYCHTSCMQGTKISLIVTKSPAPRTVSGGIFPKFFLACNLKGPCPVEVELYRNLVRALLLAALQMAP